MEEMENHTEDSGREKHQKSYTKPLIITCIVLLLVVGAAVTTWAVVGRDNAKKITVPELVGLSESDAFAVLSVKGLACEVAYEETEEDQEGLVLGQDPQPGTSLEELTTITITVGRAHSRSITMPGLVGMSREEALARLQVLGFNPEFIDIETQVANENGVIISQEPVEGTILTSQIGIKLGVGKYVEQVAADEPSAPVATYVTCPTCGGTGKVNHPIHSIRLEDCTNCINGTVYENVDGQVFTHPCSVCGGRGSFEIEVEIPNEVPCDTCGGSGKVQS
jgi:beta-lactam-binding protein with PASTA domain